MAYSIHAFATSRGEANVTWNQFWRRFRRNKFALAGLAIVVILILVAFLAPYVSPHDPNLQDLPSRRAVPGAKFLLGADEFGRDILSRTIFGARVALRVGVVATGMGLAAGVAVGLIAGFLGGWVDEILMRAMDILLAFPYLLLAIAIASALGPGELNTQIAIAVWTLPSFARLIRGSVISLKEREFVEAARAMGAGNQRIIWRHLLPNALSPIIVYGTLFVARAIMMEAALSFLGLGVQPPTASWGNMISAGRNYLRLAPHIATVPGLAIAITVLAFNLLGDGLRDALDPRMKDA
jgi:peptide/nickel transport system permease protein